MSTTFTKLYDCKSIGPERVAGRVMSRQTNGIVRTMRRGLGSLAVLVALPCVVYAAGPAITFSVGPDEALTYPVNSLEV
jgi:hypothetical protein